MGVLNHWLITSQGLEHGNKIPAVLLHIEIVLDMKLGSSPDVVPKNSVLHQLYCLRYRMLNVAQIVILAGNVMVDGA
ncbi:hypothetical protein D3C76_1540970 [compost metagenome]